MKPSQVASKLRQIATAIDNSCNPRRGLVAADLKRIIAAVGSQVSDFTGEIESHTEGEDGELKGTINVDGNNINIEGFWNSGSRGPDYVLNGQTLDRLDLSYKMIEEHFDSVWPAQAWPPDKHPDWKAAYHNDQIVSFIPI